MCGEDGVWYGDFQPADAEDMNAVAGCRVVDGNVIITSSEARDARELRDLSSIHGNLIFLDNFELETLAGIDAMTDVWGNVVVRGNAALTDIDDLRFVSLAGSLAVIDNVSLAGVDHLLGVDALAQLDVARNDALVELHGPDLVEVGPLTVQYNEGLERVDLPAVTAVVGDLDISGNPSLVELSLPSLQRVTGALVIRDNPALPTCAAAQLANQLVALGYAGAVDIAGNDDAGSCGSPAP